MVCEQRFLERDGLLHPHAVRRAPSILLQQISQQRRFGDADCKAQLIDACLAVVDCPLEQRHLERPSKHLVGAPASSATLAVRYFLGRLEALPIEREQRRHRKAGALAHLSNARQQLDGSAHVHLATDGGRGQPAAKQVAVHIARGTAGIDEGDHGMSAAEIGVYTAQSVLIAAYDYDEERRCDAIAGDVRTRDEGLERAACCVWWEDDHAIRASTRGQERARKGGAMRDVRVIGTRMQ